VLQVVGHAGCFSAPAYVAYIFILFSFLICSPNWTGSIKIPSVTMMADKLAALAGAMPNSGGTESDRGDGIDHESLINKLYFL
jgi:hypothetical protein